MRNKRIIIVKIVAAISLVISILSGCTYTPVASKTFKLDSGERVQVKLDTTGGYKLKKNGRSFVICDRERSTEDSSFTITGEIREGAYDSILKDNEAQSILVGQGENTSHLEGNENIYITKITKNLYIRMNCTGSVPEDIMDHLVFIYNKEKMVNPSKGLAGPENT